MGIHLISSSPDLYNNTITSENVSLPYNRKFISESQTYSFRKQSFMDRYGKNRFTSAKF